MSQKLGKIMVKNVITAKPSNTLNEVAELMSKHEIGCVIIVDNGKAVGIVTERDMIKRVICRHRDPEEASVREIMSRSLMKATPEMCAGDAAKLMLEQNIKKLPVVEHGKLLGLVTLTDLIRSEGVIELLNGLSLNGVSRRLKKVVEIYFDAEHMCGIAKKRKRRCPLMMKDGFSVGCEVEKCMWWIGDECAVSKISRHLETTQTGGE